MLMTKKELKQTMFVKTYFSERLNKYIINLYSGVDDNSCVYERGVGGSIECAIYDVINRIEDRITFATQAATFIGDMFTDLQNDDQWETLREKTKEELHFEFDKMIKNCKPLMHEILMPVDELPPGASIFIDYDVVNEDRA